MKRRQSDDGQDGDERVKNSSSTSDVQETIVNVDRSLLKAVEDDNAADVKYWLDQGANVYGEGFYKNTWPMFVASKHNSAQAMRVLLQYGADKNQQDEVKYTPLLDASNQGSLDVVQLLLDEGCDVNQADTSGCTALAYACTGTNDAMVKLLLSRSADVHAEIMFCQTALFRASICGQVGIMQLLVDHGADIHHIDLEERTALFDASRGSNASDAVRWLLEHGADVNHVNYWGQTPLFGAVVAAYVSNCTETVKVLLECGASVHHEDDNLDTPLHRARGAKVAELLIQHGADVNHINAKGHSVALSMVQIGSVEALDVVLRHGGKILDIGNVITDVLVYATEKFDTDRAFRMIRRSVEPRVLKWHGGAWIQRAVTHRWRTKPRLSLFATMLAGRIG